MILALKTSDNTTLAWMYPAEGGEPVADLTWESGRTLSDELLGRIVEFLKSHDATIQDLTGIVIFSGPGSFTSLRIGHTVADSLADSLGIPVAGAAGDDWAATATAALKTTHLGQPALPHYGAEANVTRPKP